MRAPFDITIDCQVAPITLPTAFTFCTIPGFTSPVAATPRTPEINIPDVAVVPPALCWSFASVAAGIVMRNDLTWPAVAARIGNATRDCGIPDITASLSVWLPCTPRQFPPIQNRATYKLTGAPLVSKAEYTPVTGTCAHQLKLDLVIPCMPFGVQTTGAVVTAPDVAGELSVTRLIVVTTQGTNCRLAFSMLLQLPTINVQPLDLQAGNLITWLGNKFIHSTMYEDIFAFQLYTLVSGSMYYGQRYTSMSYVASGRGVSLSLQTVRLHVNLDRGHRAVPRTAAGNTTEAVISAVRPHEVADLCPDKLHDVAYPRCFSYCMDQVIDARRLQCAPPAIPAGVEWTLFGWAGDFVNKLILRGVQTPYAGHKGFPLQPPGPVIVNAF